MVHDQKNWTEFKKGEVIASAFPKHMIQWLIAYPSSSSNHLKTVTSTLLSTRAECKATNKYTLSYELHY